MINTTGTIWLAVGLVVYIGVILALLRGND